MGPREVHKVLLHWGGGEGNDKKECRNILKDIDGSSDDSGYSGGCGLFGERYLVSLNPMAAGGCRLSFIWSLS